MNKKKQIISKKQFLVYNQIVLKNGRRPAKKLLAGGLQWPDILPVIYKKNFYITKYGFYNELKK